MDDNNFRLPDGNFYNMPELEHSEFDNTCTKSLSGNSEYTTEIVNLPEISDCEMNCSSFPEPLSCEIPPNVIQEMSNQEINTVNLTETSNYHELNNNTFQKTSDNEINNDLIAEIPNRESDNVKIIPDTKPEEQSKTKSILEEDFDLDIYAS